MIDEKDNGVITNYYKDLSTGRPIVKIKTEKQTVNSLKNVIQLMETPDEQERVTIVDSTDMIEVDNYEDLTEENQYWVDYKNPLGNIYFHPSKKAQTYNIKYGSKGYTLISANKIFTKLDEDGNVVEVLSDILEQGRDIIDELLILGGGVQVFYKLQQAIADGSELHTNLQSDISTGQPLHTQLRKDINDANTFKDQLNEDVADGKILDESLKVQNPRAEQNLANLNQAMTDCADDIANITKTDNGVAIVTTENWGSVDSEGFYHCTVTHTANSKDLNLDIFDYTNNIQGESVFVTVTPLTDTTFKVSSIENTPIKIVFASGYYGGYTSANTRDAINGLENEKQNKLDNLLETTNKSIPLAINEVKSQLEESKSEINLNKNDIISIFAELLEKATKEELEVLNTRMGEIIAQAGDGTIPSELVDIRTGLSGTVYASSGNAVRAIASGREIQENVLEHKHMKINYLYGFVDKVIEINTTDKTVFIPNEITVFYHSYYRNPLNMNTTINYSNLDTVNPIYLVLDLNSKNIICVEKQYNNKDYVLIAVIYGTQIKTFDITKFKVNGIVNGGFGNSIKENQLTFNYRIGQALITSGDRFIIDTNLKTLKLPKTMYVLSLNKFSSPLNVNTTIDFSDLDTNYPLFIYYNFNDRNIKVVVRNTYDKDNCLIGILQQNKILNCFRTQDFIVNDVTNGGWGNETSNGGLKDNLFVTAYGDSITYGGVWFSNLLGRYNLRGLNMGWSNTRISYVNETNYINPDGTHNIIPSNTVPPNTKPEEAIEVPASFCSPERIAYIPSDSNFVLIAGGTNDFLYNVPLGTFDGANTTFKGALMSTYKQVVERCANAEVIFITPPPIPQDIDNGEPRTNSLGLKVIDYRNAIIEFCELYGIKYIDVYIGANIPCMYPSKYFKDRVHPSTVGEDSGQIRMYRYIAKEFEPCLLMKGI